MIRFLLDDEEIALGDVSADLTVLDWLRLHRQRTGTKEGCGSGDCGACTVVVAAARDGELRYESINACIVFVGSLHGRQLLTVESLGAPGSLHPVQQAMVDEHGSQCGFCTPGFVMSMFAMVAAPDAPRVRFVGAFPDDGRAGDASEDRTGPAPTPVAESRSPDYLAAEVEPDAHADAVVTGTHASAAKPVTRAGGWLEGLQSDDAHALSHHIDRSIAGNLCRCTGYRPIKRAAAVALARGTADAALPPKADAARALVARLEALQATVPEHAGYHLPGSLDELAKLRTALPEARLVAGGTDLALEVTQAMRDLPSLIDVNRVPELQRLEWRDEVLVVGAAVSLTRLLAELETRTALADAATLLLRFGSDPIRNRGTVGGNIASASPIGDLPPLLIALGATLVLQRGRTTRELPVEDYFLDYRETALAADEFLREVQLPMPEGDAFVAVHKISKRMEDDISAVCGAFHLTLAPVDETEAAGTTGTAAGVAPRIAFARIAFGGMAATPKRARALERALVGSTFDAASVARAEAALDEDFAPISDARASAGYRLQVAKNLLTRVRIERAEPGIATRVAHWKGGAGAQAASGTGAGAGEGAA